MNGEGGALCLAHGDGVIPVIVLIVELVTQMAVGVEYVAVMGMACWSKKYCWV